MAQGKPFEESMLELESIVNQLDKGELKLEDSLKQFEKAMSLSRHCQDLLNSAEKKIATLSIQGDSTEVKSDDE